jgi:hypothetical protein
VEWWSDPGIITSFIVDTKKSTSHSVFVEKLKPDTIYCFTVVSKDASRNKGTSEARCFTTRSTEAVPFSTWTAWFERYRDPEFALKHGYLGYVDITWLDDPRGRCS